VTTYYRTTDGRRDIELTAQQFGALVQSKRDVLRVFIVDPRPADTATDKTEPAGIVVGPIEAHDTWVMRPKTQAELDVDDLTAEQATNAQLILDIKTQLDIDNPAFNAMTTNDKFIVLRQDRRLLLRSCRFLLRIRQGVAITTLQALR